MKYSIRILTTLLFLALLTYCILPTEEEIGKPEIVVKESGTTIFSGSGSYDFDETNIGESSTVTFIISNTGNAQLILTGNPRVLLVGSDSSHFNITQPVSSNVPASGLITFEISFSPTSEGEKTATVTIANNDETKGSYNFSITGTGVLTEEPEIEIVAGSTSVASSGTHDVGNAVINTNTNSTTFTIKNTGAANLTLSGSTLVSVSGTNSSDFVVTQPSSSAIAASSELTFTVVFTPTTSGAKAAVLTIESNDSDEGSYTINLTGTATATPEPEMNIVVDSASVASSGSYDFGSISVASNNTVTFTIENIGSADLNLTGSTMVALSGTNSSEFSITQPSSSNIAAASQTTFTIAFNPTSQGSKTATISIENDDSNENPYTLTLTGAATVSTEPEINILVGSTPIASAGSHNFGSVNVGASLDVTFKIQNAGNSTLNLTGSSLVAISGTNSNEFSVSQPNSSTISASGEVTFTVTFSPSSQGTKTATLTIVSNDSDEGTYTVTLTGSATTTPEPEINLLAGSTSVSSSGSHDVGSVEVGSTSSTTFTIQNTGTADLSLTGSPLVAVSGTNSSDFVVTQPSSSIIAASGQTTFTVTFGPSLEGTKTATLTIINNDTDESTYTVTLTGTATTGPEPEINLLANSTTISSSGSYDVGSVDVGSSNSTTFIVQNIGTADLIITGSPLVAISGTNSSDFVVTQPSSSTITPSGLVTFSVTFSPSTEGSKTAALTIESNDTDEGTYTINLTGTATVPSEPEIDILVGTNSVASSSTYDVGSTDVGSTGILTTFTINNTGTENLSLTGSTLVAISGTNSSDFVVTQPSSSIIAASGNITFTVNFNPSASGSKTATLTIANNDTDEGTYIINLTGTATTPAEPEMNILIGATSIASSSSYDVGSTDVGSTGISTTFTIQNTGTADLNLTGSPLVAISGTNSSDFTVTQPSTSTITASGNTTFTVDFNPSAEGSKTATLTIENNDSDENPYTITITGTANAAAEPEIDIQLAGSSIASSGSIDFSSVELGGTRTYTLTILNTGSGTLNLTSSPIVSISGIDQSLFTITQPSANSIAAGGNLDFSIQFNPVAGTSTGSKSATITISNNDSDEGTYTISVLGNVTLTATKLLLTIDGGSTINNNNYYTLRATAANANDFTVTTYTGTVSLSIDSGFTLSPSSITISSGGTGSIMAYISKSDMLYQTVATITGTATGLSSGTLALTVNPVFNGTELTEAELGGSSIYIGSGTKYIKPKQSSDAAIPVGGDITVAPGATLVIYRGVTLDMRTYSITVNGILDIKGVDDNRVRLKSSSNNWGGIWVGTLSGTTDGKLTMDGAYIDGTASSPVTFGYASSGTYRANTSTITNSRLEVSSSLTREVIDFMYTKSGATYTVRNSILVSGYENPMYLSGNSDGAITLVVSYNTIVGKTSGSNNIAIEIRTNYMSTYTIEHNIFTGRFSNAVYSNDTYHTLNIRYNVFNINSSITSGVGMFSLTDNVEDPTTLTIGWNDSYIFTNYGSNDFRLLQSGTYPTLTQVYNYTSMEGCLSNNHVNQKGAYGNSGTPPTPLEN